MNCPASAVGGLYSYDASGDLLSDGPGNSFSYDAAGRLTSTDGTTDYVYDGLDRRAAKCNSNYSQFHIQITRLKQTRLSMRLH